MAGRHELFGGSEGAAPARHANNRGSWQDARECLEWMACAGLHARAWHLTPALGWDTDRHLGTA